MDSLKGGGGLIIDPRSNDCGQDCGDEILARLAASPITRPGAERRVRFQRTPEDLNPYLDTWDNSFRTLRVGAIPAPGGFYGLTDARGDDRILPCGQRLDVRTAALIGPVDSSATFQFADKAGTSGLEFDLPLIGFFPPGHPSDAGLTPDEIVKPTPAGLAAGHDRTLESAAKWSVCS